MPKSTYEYHHAKDQNIDNYAREKELVKHLYEQSCQTYGYRRTQLALKHKEGISKSDKTVLKLMQSLGIRPLQRKRDGITLTKNRNTAGTKHS